MLLLSDNFLRDVISCATAPNRTDFCRCNILSESSASAPLLFGVVSCRDNCSELTATADADSIAVVVVDNDDDSVARVA
jgi:hypothetical protein